MLYNPVNINNGYLATPFSVKHLTSFVEPDDVHYDHYTGWDEYAYWTESVYPNFLAYLAKAGIPFLWEYTLTEDFSYFAYNFPTDEVANNLVHFRTGRRKRLPHLNKKMIKELEIINAANTLLYELGISHGPHNA